VFACHRGLLNHRLRSARHRRHRRHQLQLSRLRRRFSALHSSRRSRDVPMYMAFQVVTLKTTWMMTTTMMIILPLPLAAVEYTPTLMREDGGSTLQRTRSPQARSPFPSSSPPQRRGSRHSGSCKIVSLSRLYKRQTFLRFVLKAYKVK